MEIGNLQLFLYFIVYISELIIKINLLEDFKKNNIDKNGGEFFGITIMIFISNILAYFNFAWNSTGFTSAFWAILICACVFICDVILFIIGLEIKNKKQKLNSINDTIIKEKSFIKSSIITLICNIIIIFIIPIIIQKMILGNGGKHVIKYLEQKYGNDGNYRVVNIGKDYEHYGMVDKYLVGYYYEIKSDYMENTFVIRIDDEFSNISTDLFLPVYYSEKNNLNYRLDCSNGLHYDFQNLEKYIKDNIENETEKKFKIYDICGNYTHLWDSYGRIPSINEIVDSIKVYYK